MKTTRIDYLSLSGHKIHGPKGVGTLFVRKKAPFTPFLHGGHQERGYRGGTENVASLVGLGKAAEIALEGLSAYTEKVKLLRDRLENTILSTVPQSELNGSKTLRLPNTANFTFHGVEAEALLLLLDTKNICASSGSACLADSDEPSHVVKAMKPEIGSRNVIRFSLSTLSTSDEIDQVAPILKGLVQRLQS